MPKVWYAGSRKGMIGASGTGGHMAHKRVGRKRGGHSGHKGGHAGSGRGTPGQGSRDHVKKFHNSGALRPLGQNRKVRSRSKIKNAKVISAMRK